MRVFVLAFVAFMTLSCGAFAAPFDPKPEQICTPREIKPGEYGQIEPHKLLGQVIKSAGLSEIDLDTNGGEVTLSDKKAAILDPINYCSTPNKCSKDTDKALATAFVNLSGLIRRSATNVPRGEGPYFEIYRKANPGQPVSVRELLADSFENIIARCVVPAKKGGGSKENGKGDQSKDVSKAPPDKTPVAGRFMVRKKVTDLQYAQDEKQKFKALDRASLSIVDDYVKRSVTYNIDGVAGFGLSHVSLGNHADADLVGYMTYTRNTFVSGAPKTKTEVDNIGVGLLSNIIFPAAGDYHGLQIYPQYLQSRVSNGQLFSTTVVYSPMTWPLVGAPIPLMDHLVGVLTPQAKFVYGRVLDHGLDKTFVAQKDFERAGGRIELLVVADGGLFNGFSWRNAYEYQYVIQGKYKSVDRFESTISYKFPEQQFWSLDLAYVSGRNLDTLEYQQQLTLGVGFKY